MSNPFDPLLPGPVTTPLVSPGQYVFPEDSIAGRIERNQKAKADAEHSAALAAKIALIARVVPSLPGRVLATFGAGVEKTAEGKIVPGKGVVGNFGPKPFGFMDAEDFGLKPNFYLPAGSTKFIPRALDQYGIGTTEQRVLDQASETQRSAAKAQGTINQARNFVRGESDETLRDLAARRGGFSRAGTIFGTSGLTVASLVDAAGAEIRRRASGGATTAEVMAALDPVLNPPVPPGGEVVRFVAAETAEAGLNAVSAAVQEVDRLFAANPPDP